MSSTILDFKIISIDGEKYEVEITTINELRSIIQFATDEKIPIITVPQDEPLEKGIWIYSNFNKIYEINGISKYIETQPDITLDRLKEKLGNAGYIWNNEFLCQNDNKTLREFFQYGWGLQISPSYGKVRDTFLAGTFILPSGKIFETVKTPRSAAGPDIGRFSIGTGETLMLPLKIATRIFKAPEIYNEYLISFNKFTDGINFIREMITDRIHPEGLFYLAEKLLVDNKLGEHISGNTLFFKIPVYNDNLGNAIDRYIKNNIMNGKLFGKDETLKFTGNIEMINETIPCKRIYASNWSNIKKLKDKKVAMLSPTPEGIGFITNDEIDEKNFLLTYDSNFKNKMRYFKRNFPDLFKKFVEIKQEVDPNNIFNPHLLNLEE